MYIVIDSENTGLFDYKAPADAPHQPRLAELTMLYVSPELEIEREYNALIKPDGWTMPPEATEIHGLTHEMLMEKGVPVREALEAYTAAIAEGRAMAAHNAVHDAKQIRGELRRAGMPDQFESAPNLCTMRSLTDICRIPKANGHKGWKWPTLTEACDFLGIEQHAKHSSHGDAMAVFHLMRRMKQLGALPEAKVHFAKNPPVR